MDASPPAALGLPRARRLRERREFTRAKEQGRRLVQGGLILNWVPAAARLSQRHLAGTHRVVCSPGLGLPVHPHLLGIRLGGCARPRRAARLLAGEPPALPLPSVGPVRLRPRATKAIEPVLGCCDLRLYWIVNLSSS